MSAQQRKSYVADALRDASLSVERRVAPLLLSQRRYDTVLDAELLSILEQVGSRSADPRIKRAALTEFGRSAKPEWLPAVLDALRSDADSALLEAQGLKVKCETEHVNLPHDRETALALSLREAATNIRRHSGATGVTIRVRQEPSAVVVEVADDGRGGRIVPGNGLNGMRERLDSVGGTLSLVPNKDGGTLLRASVPIAA
jgi:signal transduction histidine kinase